jgi:outer membrane autotransporter protein
LKSNYCNFQGRNAFVPKAIALAVSLLCASASASAAPITLTGDYIKIGTNDVGTIGSGNSTSPGILYDNTGTGTFNTAYDYLTPGTPFEGFAVRATAGGTTYNVTSNNSGLAMTSGLTGTLTDISSGAYKGVQWTGSYTPAASAKLFDIVNTVGFNSNEKRITITTTITAGSQGLTNLYFARYTDPDARATAGDSSATNNFRGSGAVAATNLVYAEALASKYVIGLYSAAASGVNTGIGGCCWPTDPTFYYGGANAGNGDNSIGIAFLAPTVNADGSVTYTYYYIFGSDIAAAVSSNVGGLSVLTSSVNMTNSPAYGAAGVIDANAGLKALFVDAGLSSHGELSGAASQTLPLLTGGSVVAAQDVLRDIGRIVQARLASNSGMSTGDVFEGDKNFWMKPFGSMADQNDRNGVAGYKANTFGLAIGVDGAVTKALRIGGAFAYAKSDINGQSSIAPQSALVDVYHLLGYGSYSIDDRTEINFQAGIGQNENKGRRQIAFTSSLASSDFSSETANVGVGIGRTYRLSTETSVTPSVRLDYTWIKDKAYSETGAGLLNLNVSGRETDALIVGVDGKVAHQLNAQTTLIGNLGVGYDTINKQSAITSAFAGAPTAAFVTYGIDPSPWLARGGMGGVYKTKSGLEITARYDAEYRESFLNQTASVKARWAF